MLQNKLIAICNYRVHAIIMIVPMIHIMDIIPATTTLVGIGPGSVLGSADVSLSNISQSALKIKKLPQFIVSFFAKIITIFYS